MLHGEYSSGFTGIYKYVFPPVWIGGFGWGTYQLFANPDSVTFNGVRGGAPPGVEWLFLAAWLCGTAFLLFLASRLVWVRVGEGILYFSGGVAAKHVHPSWVRSVTELSLLRPRMISIQFMDEAGRNRSVWVMPSFSWLSGARADPEFFSELQTLVAQARRPAA